MKKSERVEKTSLNIKANIFIYILQSLLAFVLRVVFIRKLGAELLGLNNLIINIVTLLTVVESGFSTVISYKLYKPLAQNKTKKISAIMNFYKKGYRIIGTIIIVIGIIVSLFLKKIVGDFSYKYLYLVYFIYLLNAISLYFISYKEVLLIADQKNYKLFKFNCFFTFFMYLLQIIILYIKPNNILYLFIFVICKVVNRILNNIYITRYYRNIDFNSNNKLNKKEINDIKKNVYNISLFKIGDYIVSCTDSILISSIINITYVFIYSSYLSIINVLRTIIKKVYDSITASFGNLTVLNNKDNEYYIFKIMYFLCFLISGYVTICLLNVFNIFIELWIGKEYVLGMFSVCIICFNFYLMSNQFPLDTIKEAEGFYDKDKFVPILLALINIILSILLGKIFGFNGIIISTSISYLLTVFWNKPYVVYRNILKKSTKEYFLDQIKFILVIILIYAITYKLFNFISLKVSLFSFIIVGLVSTLIYCIIILILFWNRYEFKYLLNIFKNYILKNKK